MIFIWIFEDLMFLHTMIYTSAIDKFLLRVQAGWISCETSKGSLSVLAF